MQKWTFAPTVPVAIACWPIKCDCCHPKSLAPDEILMADGPADTEMDRQRAQGRRNCALCLSLEVRMYPEADEITTSDVGHELRAAFKVFASVIGPHKHGPGGLHAL
jgi:hypothetical protein